MHPNIPTFVALSFATRQALRLFVGEPVWTPYNRPQDEHPSRAKYVTSFAKAA